MEQAENYLVRYQQGSEDEKDAVVAEYQTFLNALGEEDRQAARTFMQAALRPKIEETVNELDKLTEKADLLLKGKIIYSSTP